ncbi:MAG: IS1 family transposase [Planctomycetia bacterium]|nr:IS1 family transposase [Planctomycetia bacterium]
MNKLTLERRCAIVRCLVEGSSLRSTARITGIARNTVNKLLVDIGAACAEYQNRVLRNLPCRRLQLDEIWSFVYAKAKNVPAEKQGEFGVGDVWTWTAICADTKLVPSWLVGLRDGYHAAIFVKDLASRLAKRVQLTTDGLKSYLDAVDAAFATNVDYAMLVKMYGADPAESETRYSPAKCVGCERKEISGQPDPEHVSTSYAERQNLTMRMMMRRFTRLTNAFSKKVENHAAAVSLHFCYYNFARIHQTLRMAPAMAAGVSPRLWSIEDIVRLLEVREKNPN